MVKHSSPLVFKVVVVVCVCVFLRQNKLPLVKPPHEEFRQPDSHLLGRYKGKLKALYASILIEPKLGLCTISSKNCSWFVFLTTNIGKLIFYLLSQCRLKSHSWGNFFHLFCVRCIDSWTCPKSRRGSWTEP